MAVTLACPAHAQNGLQKLLEDVQSGDLSKLQDLQDAGSDNGTATLPENSTSSNSNTSMPDVSLSAVLPATLSSLEEDYRQRLSGGAMPVIPGMEADETSSPYLAQFGYDALWVTVGRPSANPVGVVRGDYVLGTGDTVIAAYRGERSRSIEAAVNREGKLILPDLPPLDAAGVTLEDLQAVATEEAKASLAGTRVFLSLSRARQLTVLVSGNVIAPGSKTVSSFATVVDALVKAGGVQKTGTLRRIRLQRGNTVRTIDLYGVLQGDTVAQDYRLRDGDRIIVPAIGHTMAVAGSVNQPGIFELPPGTHQMPIATALRYAGGGLRSRGNRLLRQHIDSSGQETVRPVNQAAGGVLADSDILIVERSNRSAVGMVSLEGYVHTPLKRALASAPTLKALIGSRQALPADAWLLLGLIERRNSASGLSEWQTVNILDALEGRQPVTLKDQDRVIVLSQADIRYLWSADIRAVLEGRLPPSLALDGNPPPPAAPPAGEVLGPDGTPLVNGDTKRLMQARQQGTNAPMAPSARDTNDEPGQRNLLLSQDEGTVRKAHTCRGLELLTHVITSQSNERFINARRAFSSIIPHGGRSATLESYQPCPTIYDANADILPLLLESVVAVTGEVQLPGAYPVAGNATLRSVLAAAGGLTRNADGSDVSLSTFSPAQGGEIDDQRLSIDVANPATRVSIQPGNFITVNRKASSVLGGVVELSGQFKRPGLYDIRENETLSSVINRAGGYTETAYPYGTVFTRKNIQQEEKRNYERLARQLETNMINVASEVQGRDNAGAVFTGINKLTDNLRKTPPLGRMVIEADLATLAARPDLDILLESGDKIHVPKRPTYVMVSGEVLNPGAQKYQPDLDASDYVEAAGGMQRSADDDRIFVVLPNGEAKPVSLSSWNYEKTMIPPGSAIVVPTDPVPFTLLTAFRDVGGVLNQLALTAASLAVISRD